MSGRSCPLGTVSSPLSVLSLSRRDWVAPLPSLHGKPGLQQHYRHLFSLACSKHFSIIHGISGSEANAMWSPMEELQLNIWMLLHARTSTGFKNLTTPNFYHRVLLKTNSCWGVREGATQGCVLEARCDIFHSIYVRSIADLWIHMGKFYHLSQ